MGDVFRCDDSQFKSQNDAVRQRVQCGGKTAVHIGVPGVLCAVGADSGQFETPTRQESQDDTDTQKNKLQDFATKSPLLLVGVAFVSGWLIALCVYCLNQNKSDKVTAFQLSDMEMTETNRGYTDQPEESISDDEEENIFT